MSSMVHNICVANAQDEKHFDNPPFSAEYILPLKVKNGREKYVTLYVSEDHLTAGDYGSRDIYYVLTTPKYIDAPVRKGQCIGMITYYCDDVLLYQSKMCAENSVKRKDFAYVLKNMFVKMLK